MQRAALASLLRRFASDTAATTAVEYAILASGIMVAIIGAVATLGTHVRDDLFQKIYDAFPQQ